MGPRLARLGVGVVLALAGTGRCVDAQAAAPATAAADCEWCGAAEAPAVLTAEARLAPAGEPGTPLVVTGVVYRPDGRTPAAGVLVYAYHTKAAGVYPSFAGATGKVCRYVYLLGMGRTE